MTIQVGQPAPEFEGSAYFRDKDNTDAQFAPIKSSDFSGKWLCLFFYPLDFTFVCPTEIVAFNDALGAFTERNCALVTASTDSVYSHKGWCDNDPTLADLKIPMIGDNSHTVSSAFGVLDAEKGLAYRGIYIINPEGVLSYMAVHDLPVGRNVDEIIRVLDALQTGELTPCNWKKGDSTL